MTDEQLDRIEREMNAGGIPALVEEIRRLRVQLAEFPHTADGVLVHAGMVLECPRGHRVEIYASAYDVYCTKGECWMDCQSDDGGGTHYPFSEYRSAQ